MIETSWGPRFLDDGRLRFRLWAPGEENVSLIAGGKSTRMEQVGQGWFEAVRGGAGAGTSYRFRLGDGTEVPDPAARAQAGDVHGPSLVVDPSSYHWKADDWQGRPWEEAVIYELHVGAFTEAGTFSAAMERLDHLADTGITAIELMPVAQFSGRRGWGYDGVLIYAPHPSYGTPDEMKAFVDAAHRRGLMVLLDVVYNHFGPDGNYLHAYAPQFFHAERHTPWGPAIAYDRKPVRDFFIDNALYWLGEFRLDGLRFDAIDSIVDEGPEPELMVEVAERIRERFSGRRIHLTTEDSRNITRLHERGPGGEVELHTAEWNDDVHNVLHVIATGEGEGYYEDFVEDPWGKLARGLAQGFVYQGEASKHAGGRKRGAPSAHQPPTAFVDFLQNHDQVGNRGHGERLSVLADPHVVELMTAMLLLSPHIPLLFMGEEFGETRPFRFFTDFHGDLARAVREGRRREFARFAAFAGHEAEIPDPNDPQTFAASRLDWDKLDELGHRARLGRVKELLAARRSFVVPMLAQAKGDSGRVIEAGDGFLAVDWRLGGGTLRLRVNLGTSGRQISPAEGEIVHADPRGREERMKAGDMPARSILVTRQIDGSG